MMLRGGDGAVDLDEEHRARPWIDGDALRPDRLERGAVHQLEAARDVVRDRFDHRA